MREVWRKSRLGVCILFGITILYMAGPRFGKLVAPAACQRPAHDASGASACTAGGAVRPGNVAIPGRPPSAQKHVIVKCVIFTKGMEATGSAKKHVIVNFCIVGGISVLQKQFLYCRGNVRTAEIILYCGDNVCTAEIISVLRR